MDYITKREIGIPPTAKKIQYPEIKYIVYTWEKDKKFYVKVFGGRRTKADSYNMYNDSDVRQNSINLSMKEKYGIAAAEKERKINKKIKETKAFEEVKVGDIFYTSWGYDQTNIEFYKLMKLKGKTGTFQGLSLETVPGSEGYMSSQVIPGDKFTTKPFTSRITGNVATQMKYGQRARKTESSKSHYCSWYA